MTRHHPLSRLIPAAATAVVLGAAVLAPAASAAKPKPVVKTAARYKISLGEVGRASLKVEAFDARMTLRIKGAKRREAVAAELREELAETPCPGVEVVGSRILIRCQTRKIVADLRRRGKKTALILYQLRGSPTSRNAYPVPLIPFAPEQTFDLGGPCPGDTVSGRAECALIDGDIKRATTLFRASLGTLQHSHAAVRLGDLALRKGKVEKAVAWWRRAERVGPWGRLARARICNINGTCFDPRRPSQRYDPLDPVALPGPLYDEVALRRARALVFEGRSADAVRFLVGSGRTTVNSHACRFDIELCQRIGIVAFDEAGDDVLPAGLVLHSQLAGHKLGPLAFAFAERAARHAERIGAPLYGANALAAVTASAPRAKVAGHLARTARLYLEGDDVNRARIVLKFARARFSDRMDKGPWPVLFQRLASATAEYGNLASGATKEDDDVARARALLARLANGKESATGSATNENQAPSNMAAPMGGGQ